MKYTTPKWLRWLAGPGLTWEMPAEGRSLYLTFDDGPDPETTPRILDMLERFGAPATFFCVGDNVEKYPELFQELLERGHGAGNHGQKHRNGWLTPIRLYLNDVMKSGEMMGTDYFRPPYGKMTPWQRQMIRREYQIIMWTVLSRDWDEKVSAKECLENTWAHTRPGAIVVFHDNMKAMEKLEKVLPEYLQRAVDEGYRFRVFGEDD